MPSSSKVSLNPNELATAVSILAKHLQVCNVQYSIAGGAASTLLRLHYNVAPRVTEDIDLVVQPRDGLDAQGVSQTLVAYYPDTFTTKKVFGVDLPVLKFQRHDGSVVSVDIEMFDILAWPQRPQYNLNDPDNDQATITVQGVEVNVFSPRWLLREKIVTAYERAGARKEASDLTDAEALLLLVPDNCLDLSTRDDAVQHVLSQMPENETLLQLKIYCPNVLGATWNGESGIYWRIENDGPWYLNGLTRHRFLWDEETSQWYLNDANGGVWWIDENSKLVTTETS
jgi:hypothetical protein